MRFPDGKPASDSLVHVVPFQCNARGEPVLAPTAWQLVALEQATLSSVSEPLLGVASTVHELPFQRSASGSTSGPLTA